MKRKLSCILVLCLLFALLAAVPASAYVRISYGADCLAEEAQLIKTALRGDPYCFTEADFKQALGITRLQNVTILSLPPAGDGVLSLSGTPVTTGQMINAGDIASLTFTPAGPAFAGTSFRFCVNSQAGSTALTCTLRVSDRVNYAPTTELATESSLFVSTQKDIAVYGQMQAKDPEGDPLTYLIVSYPTKGCLTVLDDASGEFRYLPASGMTGKDRFTYVARDSYGNYSTATTVSVQIKQRESTLVYADMENHPAYLAALSLSHDKIMMGDLEGDHMYFVPDGTVSRAEFVVMAMKSAGVAPAAGVKETWFDDDDKIKDTVKQYIATAQLYGYINGSFDGTGLYFRPNDAISRAEAAVIMNHILGAATPTILPTFADSSDIPAWAAESVYALYAAGILDTGENGSMNVASSLTRAEAAMALYALQQYE